MNVDVLRGRIEAAQQIRRAGGTVNALVNMIDQITAHDSRLLQSLKISGTLYRQYAERVSDERLDEIRLLACEGTQVDSQHNRLRRLWNEISKREELLRAPVREQLTRMSDREHNAFEPDNQSKEYKDIRRALGALGIGETRTLDVRKVDWEQKMEDDARFEFWWQTYRFDGHVSTREVARDAWTEAQKEPAK